jgi:hypothetical protein
VNAELKMVFNNRNKSGQEMGRNSNWDKNGREKETNICYWGANAKSDLSNFPLKTALQAGNLFILKSLKMMGNS